MVLILTDGADTALFKRLGLDCAALESRLARLEPVVGTEGDDAVADAARLMVLSGQTGRQRILALLFRGAMLDQLSTVDKAAQLRDLATAAARMPEWVFGQAGLTPETKRVLEPTRTRGSTTAAVKSAAERSKADAAGYQPDVSEARARGGAGAQPCGACATHPHGGTAAHPPGEAGADRGPGGAGTNRGSPGTAAPTGLDYSFEFGDELPADAEPDYAPCRDGP
jgi:hypothetical protein